MITATAKWKTPLLTVPGYATVSRLAGVMSLPEGVERWLIGQGYAKAVEAEVGVIERSEQTSSSAPVAPAEPDAAIVPDSIKAQQENDPSQLELEGSESEAEDSASDPAAPATPAARRGRRKAGEEA